MLAKTLENKPYRARAQWRVRRPSVFGNALGNRLARGPQPPSLAAQASVGLDTRYSLASNGSAGTGGMAYPEELWREIVGAAAEGPRIVDMERITVRPDPELLQANPYTAGVLE